MDGNLAGWKFALSVSVVRSVVLVLVTFGTSMLLRQVPGEPPEGRARERGGHGGSRASRLGTGAARAQCVDDQGLDDNVVVQYVNWSKDMLSGDLGYAFYKNREPLIDTIEQRMPRNRVALPLQPAHGLVLAVPLGIWSAYQAGTRRRIPRGCLPCRR